jgi:hypothetical protein
VQLVELQANLPALERAGLWPVALSCDRRTVLAAFAAARGITYPLLADEGSVVIRRLGLLTPTYGPDHPRHGVAQPATYLLDPSGRVVKAIVHASQTVRAAWPTALHDAVALAVPANVPVGRRAVAGVAAALALDSSRYRPRQRLGLRAVFAIAPGAHLYGRPLPDAYVPLTLTVAAPAGVTVEPIAYPLATSVTPAALGAALPVYSGRVELATHLIFDDLREDAVIEATVRLQVCTESACLLPQTFTVALPIRYRPPD